jgi:hypothetical protein
MRARRFRFALIAVPALIVGSFGVASPVLAAPCDASTDTLGNGGFELPAVSANTFTLFPAASVPSWQTTDGSDEIEIWGSGFLGVPAGEGNAFAEINANTDATLYQDVITTPGSTISWSLLHRGRAGVDTMQVVIGDANVVDLNSAAGWDYISPDLADGTSAWGAHSDDYVVPAGQTCTTFGFRVVSTASGGGPSVGNLLDAVAMTVALPPEPTSAPPASTSQPTAPPTDSLDASGQDDQGGPSVLAALLMLAALFGIGIVLARVRSTTRQ